MKRALAEDAILSAMPRDRLLIVFVAASAVLLFPNLDNMYLWQDEAEAALIAKNVVTYGLPKAWDGMNMLAVFFSIWLCYVYLKILEQEKRAEVEFVISAVLLFRSNYMIVFALLGALALHLALFGAEVGNRNRLAVPGMLIFAFTFPWFVYARAWSRGSPFEEYGMTFFQKAVHFTELYLIHVTRISSRWRSLLPDFSF